MASANSVSGAQEDRPIYAIPQLRLTAKDVDELNAARLAQRRYELALSTDEVFEKFRALGRLADWIRSARPAE